MKNDFHFSDRQAFIQASFNEVARIVAEHGQPCLEAFVPAFSTEQCLEHLALVAHKWAYGFTLIDAYAQSYKISNSELREENGGLVI